jgi:hypothetical protein
LPTVTGTIASCFLKQLYMSRLDSNDTHGVTREQLKSAKPRIGKFVSRTVRRPARRVDFTMRSHRDFAAVGLAATFSQIADQFFACLQLRARGLITIKIAHQANAERNVVQIIAVDMASIDLASPSVAHFDLAITCRCSVADNEMVREAILHAPHVPVIVVEYAGVSLPRAAIVHYDELPPAPLHWRASDRFNY